MQKTNTMLERIQEANERKTKKTAAAPENKKADAAEDNKTAESAELEPAVASSTSQRRRGTRKSGKAGK